MRLSASRTAIISLPKDEPVIRVGAVEVKPTGAEAGTGFFEQVWEGAEVKPDMGRVTVTTTSDGVQWGALHWQYFERMDKVPPHESPFSVRRQVMLREQTDAGRPPVIAEPDSAVTAVYLEIAAAVEAALAGDAAGAVRQFPQINITDD